MLYAVRHPKTTLAVRPILVIVRSKTYTLCDSTLRSIGALRKENTMRLISFRDGDEARVGVLRGQCIVDVNRAYAHLLWSVDIARARAHADASAPSAMLEFLDAGEEALQAAREALDFVGELMHAKRSREWLRDEGVVRKLSEAELLAPIPRPGKILCLGLNYKDHAKESGTPLPKEPIVFSKAPTAVIGPGQAIQIPRATTEVDYEVEMAFVIGQECKEIDAKDAYDYIAGYTILNDVSARDYQLKKGGGQWHLGKSFDTFCPIGPWIVTRDEVRNPHKLDIRLRLNGKTMQHSNTRHLCFRVDAIVEYLSRVFTLEPGDVVATGTPGGVGFVRKPPRFLRRGDVLRLDIEDIGRLENCVA